MTKILLVFMLTTNISALGAEAGLISENLVIQLLSLYGQRLQLQGIHISKSVDDPEI